MNDDLPRQYIGVDVGTSRLVVYKSSADEPPTLTTELNAYIELPKISSVLTSLNNRKVPCRIRDNEVLVIGQWSTTFAELFHSELLRPMSDGCVNAGSDQAMSVLETLLEQVLGPQRSSNISLVFSVPSKGLGTSRPSPADLAFHQAYLEQQFKRLGYSAYALREGEAVIYSALADENYTGIGISFGAGLCNISFTYLSVPILDFHVARGGDWIDTNTAAVLNEKATRVRLLKERGLSLRDDGGTALYRSLSLFYRQAIEAIVAEMCAVFRNHEDMPQLDEAIPIVLAGGTAIPPGFADAFRQALGTANFPLQISEVRLARDPLNATAEGCYRYAKLNFGQQVVRGESLAARTAAD